MSRRGLFITIEGPEGGGKSTQIQRLARDLRRKGHRVTITREPGGTKLSGEFRKILLKTGEGLCRLSELFLYEADRAQHMADVIDPALKRGEIVISDRHFDSTTAYQGYGRGLDRRVIETLNRIATSGRRPDLTIVIDVPVERGLRLAHQAKRGHDRLERAGLAFHRRVRRGFLTLARKEPRRFRVIRHQEGIERTWALIQPVVEDFMNRTRR